MSIPSSFPQARSALLASLLALAGAALAGTAPAAAFPDAPVTIVVPFAAGSGTDTGTRVLAEALQPLIGQPVIVDNRPGASGAIAAGFVAGAAPDGYTLLMGTNSTQSANPLMMKSLAYDPQTDLVPIGMVGTFEGVLTVNPQRLPFATVDELVAHIKANPGEVSYATGNVTSLVMTAIFARDLGLDMLQVPYKSNPEALTAVVAGEVDLMFPDIASSLTYTKAGALKPLASVTRGEATPLAPDLVPLSQTVAPDLKLVGWIGLFAPAGTPQDVVDTLAGSVSEVVQSPDFTARLATLGANAEFLSPTELGAYIDAERASFAQIFEQIGLEPQ